MTWYLAVAVVCWVLLGLIGLQDFALRITGLPTFTDAARLYWPVDAALVGLFLVGGGAVAAHIWWR